jgi:hypothetical protein
MKDYGDYLDSVTRCLMSFQHIEEALKWVLVRLEFLAYFRIREFTPYHPKPKLDSIRNSAMGRLIDMISIYCDDPALIAELRRMKKQRDALAHQGFLMAMDDFKGKEAEEKVAGLEQLDKDAQKVFVTIVGRWGGLDNVLNKVTAEQSASARPIAGPPSTDDLSGPDDGIEGKGGDDRPAG